MSFVRKAQSRAKLNAQAAFIHKAVPAIKRGLQRLSKNPRVDKGPQPIMALFGFGDMCGKSAKGACVARLSLHEVLAAP